MALIFDTFTQSPNIDIISWEEELSIQYLYQVANQENHIGGEVVNKLNNKVEEQLVDEAALYVVWCMLVDPKVEKVGDELHTNFPHNR